MYFRILKFIIHRNNSHSVLFDDNSIHDPRSDLVLELLLGFFFFFWLAVEMTDVAVFNALKEKKKEKKKRCTRTVTISIFSVFVEQVSNKTLNSLTLLAILSETKAYVH